MPEIPLTQGAVATVDESDMPLVNAIKWSVSRDPRKKTAYAEGWVKGANAKVKMHRLILGAQPKQIVDHIDGNGLNNRRSNLRFASNAENLANSQRSANNRSGHKGVRWHKAAGKWAAGIRVNYKSIHLGLFDSVEAANDAYETAAKKYFGEFARCSS